MVVVIDPPKDTLKLLRESLPHTIPEDESDDFQQAEDSEEVLAYVSALAASLAKSQNFDPSTWKTALSPYLSVLPSMSNPGVSEETVEKFRDQAEMLCMGDFESEESDDEGAGEEICNVRFSLAYGGKILLHRTRLRLRRGRVYSLSGQNGTGKTTLMNAINNGKLEGWPSHLTTDYVDSGSNVDPVFEAKNVMDHLLKDTGKDKEKVIAMLNEIKFTQQMRNGTIGELSGGWQMKLRLAKAVLVAADILLLDEPTNHLDAMTVQWLIKYITNLKETTVICVSHDTPFLEAICTDVVHYEKRDAWGPYRKLVHYKGKMSDFVKKQPQAKHYFELATTDLLFKFPEPGRLEGIKTSTQRFLEMENVTFRYPGCDHDNLSDVNLKMSLSSRVAVVGPNGAGKTTLVKMIVGDTQPTNFGKCRLFIHHNLRVAYVAQHSFHHVEQHTEDSPVAYLQWRFKDAYDREKMDSEAFKISKEEQDALDDWNMEGIWSRRMRGGILEYEVKKRNIHEKHNKYYSKEALRALGFDHYLKQTDEKIAAVEAGLDLRPITTTEIQKHLDDFGLPQEFGTYGKVRGLSGGQKVKLVLAAAMWNCPHLLVLDEPTNYLDREALGALSAALNEWGGSVLMISHNKEFYSSVCKEEWLVNDGKVVIQGVSSEREMKAVAKKKKFTKELKVDEILEQAGGNMNADGDKYKDASTNFWGQSVSKKEARQYDKAKKKGDVALMRKVLQIPNGKVMPGFEELGDGKTK